jgi:hypothetical protein
MDNAALPRFEAMTTGALLDRAFRLYTGNFSLMLGITAAAYVPFYLVMLTLASGLGVDIQNPSGLFSILYLIAFIILWSSIAFPIAGGASTYAISERYLGNDVTIGQALSRGMQCFWTLSLAQITATVRTMFGFFLLIIPGILWMLSYSLIVPAIVVEGQKALPSLKRSRYLVKGYRGKVFSISFLILLLVFILGAGIRMILNLFVDTRSGGGAFFRAALENLGSIVMTPLLVIASILLYYDMRIRKEGFDIEMLGRAVAGKAESGAVAAI